LTLSDAYDRFWNSHFGFANPSSVALWITPYFVLTFVRSILWSVGTLRPNWKFKGAFHSLAAVYLIAVCWLGALVIGNSNEQAREAALRVSLDDLRRIILFNAQAWRDTATYGHMNEVKTVTFDIRNDLSRSVDVEQLTANFYNASGQLINTERLPARASVGGNTILLPNNSPAHFETWFMGWVQVPDSFTWTLAVSKAHYVPAQYTRFDPSTAVPVEPGR
jgi:hypothetical protein